MKFAIEHRKLLSTVVVLMTIGVVGSHYFMFGKPLHDYWWTDYGLLIFGAYVFIAFMLGWTIHLPGTSYFPEHRGWRIATLLLALFIYSWVVYTLFFRSA